MCISAAQHRVQQFQSTLPAWGSDVCISAAQHRVQQFQSTLPAWGSDNGGLLYLYPGAVSIHAPRVGERPGVGVSA